MWKLITSILTLKRSAQCTAILENPANIFVRRLKKHNCSELYMTQPNCKLQLMTAEIPHCLDNFFLWWKGGGGGEIKNANEHPSSLTPSIFAQISKGVPVRYYSLRCSQNTPQLQLQTTANIISMIILANVLSFSEEFHEHSCQKCSFFSGKEWENSRLTVGR